MRPLSRTFSLPGLRAALAVASLAAASGAASGQTQAAVKRLSDKTFEVSGRFTVAASTTLVWEVLTDYEHIPAFVSSMRSSRVVETRADGSLLVEQQAIGGMSIFSRTVRVLLEVRRSPGRLLFTDVGRADFLSYSGEWTVRPTGGGAGVGYHLLLQPRFFAPSFLLSRAMRRGARGLLDQVRAEIVRRTRAR
ncbi:MAG TPA: SRPBCC family protein [Elusimicrobiota bacterium]|jgi:uncharacterized protein YndB with AHSA1/START domain|nr:SRPBCC family protein [Elusimicrobiota bacterium]